RQRGGRPPRGEQQRGDRDIHRRDPRRPGGKGAGSRRRDAAGLQDRRNRPAPSPPGTERTNGPKAGGAVEPGAYQRGRGGGDGREKGAGPCGKGGERSRRRGDPAAGGGIGGNRGNGTQNGVRPRKDGLRPAALSPAGGPAHSHF